ncbi:hypothetical protein SAMN04489747_3437 [Auraticoccus monumenti]|uniref:Uncharacterized protein n=2 Tax=Auraticoccus monumenti TaxID=675864 RepID=A0A1G7D1T3_9ACTN|nr:hypothetical protein SAMN04489747_3437 [Auraticoccus monumenti]
MRVGCRGNLHAMSVQAVEYEVRRVRLDRDLSRTAVRRLLTDQAEYGGWELSRLRRYRDGTREAWMRRKIIRVRRRDDGWPLAADLD